MKGKKKHKGKKWRKLMQAVRAAAFLAAGVLGLFWPDGMETVRAVSLSNPRIVTDSSMRAGQKVTWDCIWFGSYPQAEVIPSNAAYTALDESLRRDGDVIVSDSVYATLQSASGWDEKNDITLNGVKYRRMKKGDATYASGNNGYYRWKNSTDYHYFKYEPIKWRVLRTDGNQALLLSDIALDDKKYCTVEGSVTWETSTLRSWLNGYGAGSNKQSADYRRKNFIGSAFTASERAAIVNSTLENADNITQGTEGGNYTTDKVFLLSEPDVWNTDTAKAYGFVKDGSTADEARRCQSSAYAKAMGMWSSTDTAYAGNGWWWLRSPGYNDDLAMYVNPDGWIRRDGCRVSNSGNGVRPALNLNLSSSNLYTYAGTVCSDGTVNEKQNYTVYFSANGGNVSPSNKFVTCGSAYGTLPAPTRSGYTFTGWYTSANGGNRVTESTIVAAASNHTLYAHWEEGESTVQNPWILPNPSAPSMMSVDLKDVARKNHAITVSSGGLSLKSATGITEADKYLSLGKIQMGAKRFTLKLKVDGVSRITYKSSSKKTASISSKGVVKIRGVGKTTITVTGILNSTGKKIIKKYTLTVNPDKMTIKSVRAVGDGRIKIYWKKDKKGDWYEMCYSRSRNFKGGKKTVTVQVSKAYTVMTVKDMVRNAKYYVRMRSCKVVSGIVYYGEWSKTKTVKVR